MSMSVQEILTGGSGALILLMTLIQIAPLKINPWSAIFRALGRALNSDVLSKLNQLEARVDNHIRVDDERNADAHRTRILQFNNELRRRIGHTREGFIEILAEIDFYERYCEQHEEYENNRAVLAIENIKRVYQEHMVNDDFL